MPNFFNNQIKPQYHTTHKYPYDHICTYLPHPKIPVFPLKSYKERSHLKITSIFFNSFLMKFGCLGHHPKSGRQDESHHKLVRSHFSKVSRLGERKQDFFWLRTKVNVSITFPTWLLPW